MIRFAAALLFLAAATAAAQEEGAVTLKLGDPAPKLHVSQWLNGEAVKEFEKGRIYVIECWATWCGPCREAIPHVSAMNTKYLKMGVVFIGMNVWEPDPSKVEPFLEKMGKKMNYVVAVDEMEGKEGKTAKAWLRAAGRDGIPCTFIVDTKGRIAWIGHPMSGMDKIIDGILEGTYDPLKEAEKQGNIQAVQKRLADAIKAKDADKTLAAADELLPLNPSLAGQLGALKFHVLLTMKKNHGSAYALAEMMARTEWKDDPQMLNNVAWVILDDKSVEKRDFDLALKLALRADELTQHGNPAVSDTLARAYAEKGMTDKAVEVLKKAIEKAGDDVTKARLKESLDGYEAKKATPK